VVVAAITAVPFVARRGTGSGRQAVNMRRGVHAITGESMWELPLTWMLARHRSRPEGCSTHSIDEVNLPPRWLPGPTWPVWAHLAGVLSLFALIVTIGARSIWESAAIGLIGGVCGAWWSNKDYWRFSRSDRIRV